jgi:hypothetical protein
MQQTIPLKRNRVEFLMIAGKVDTCESNMPIDNGMLKLGLYVNVGGSSIFLSTGDQHYIP